MLPGAREFLLQARAEGIGIALGSASKNSPLILDRLGIAGLFDAVVDGTRVHRAKPDPEVFLTGAADLGLAPDRCIVFEGFSGVTATQVLKALGLPGDMQTAP